MADGQAVPAEEAAAARHLARCPACRAAAERITVLTRLLRVRPALSCPDFVPDLMAVFDAQVSARPAVASSAVVPPERDHECGRRRPCCVPVHAIVWSVGAARCGCVPGCGCGCQSGAPCECHASVA